MSVRTTYDYHSFLQHENIKVKKYVSVDFRQLLYYCFHISCFFLLILFLVAPFVQVAKQTAGPAVVLSFAIAGDISDNGLFFYSTKYF